MFLFCCITFNQEDGRTTSSVFNVLNGYADQDSVCLLREYLPFSNGRGRLCLFGLIDGRQYFF